MAEPQTPWDKVVIATEGHDLERVAVEMRENKGWFYVRCLCGEAFTESWEFTDHIRRLVYDALEEARRG